MSFTEHEFYIFAISVVLFYYILPGRCQWAVLLISSLIFYVTYGAKQLVFIIAAAAIAWRAALRMEKIQNTDPTDNQSKDEIRRRKKSVLTAAIALLLFMLLYAKVGTAVVRSVAGALSLRAGAEYTAIVALGISYYTFSLIGYLMDVYYKKEPAERDFLRLLLFAIYFPKILQGPIARHRTLAPQLRVGHAWDYRAFCFGFQRMLWGYFKKMVIADRLALFVTPVFADFSTQSGAHLLVAACLAAVQLYCDFSGCMDIVGGFSQILGLEIEENFDHPFFSCSAAEFWRRWHITLGTWFKDYVYMPMAISPHLIASSKKVRERYGARAGKAVMTIVPTMTVWVLTGLWHSTGWNYVAWGLYWGVLIVCSNVFTPEIRKLTEALRIDTKTGSWKAFQMVRTFCLFVIGRILTVPGDLRKSAIVFKRILCRFELGTLFDGSLYTKGMDRHDFAVAVICMLLLWTVERHQEKESVRETLEKSNIIFRWAAWYVLLFAIVIFGIYGPGFDAASFVYANF